jgi:hypothetical protein
MLEEDELKNAILLVLANKQDVPGCLSVTEICKELGIESLSNRSVQLFKVSINGSISFASKSCQLVLKAIWRGSYLKIFKNLPLFPLCFFRKISKWEKHKRGSLGKKFWSYYTKIFHFCRQNGQNFPFFTKNGQILDFGCER